MTTLTGKRDGWSEVRHSEFWRPVRMRSLKESFYNTNKFCYSSITFLVPNEFCIYKLLSLRLFVEIFHEGTEDIYYFQLII